MRLVVLLVGQAARDLLPSSALRGRLVVLVLMGAAIPLADLLVMKIFTDVVLGFSGTVPPLSAIAVPVGAFATLFLVTRVAHYGQRIYRVTLFTRAFASEPRPRQPAEEGWRWALGLELVSLLTAVTQVGAVAVFFLALAPAFGIVNVAVVAVLLCVLAGIFARQLEAQRAFVAHGRARAPSAAGLKVRSRITSAERGGLVSAGLTLVQLAVLLGMALTGVVSAADTIVLYLGLRLQGSTLNTLSGSAMRFARAWALTEISQGAAQTATRSVVPPSAGEADD